MRSSPSKRHFGSLNNGAAEGVARADDGEEQANAGADGDEPDEDGGGLGLAAVALRVVKQNVLVSEG